MLMQLSRLIVEWDKRLGAPLCPCCGARMTFIDGDKFGTVHCLCKVHGPYTMQVAA